MRVFYRGSRALITEDLMTVAQTASRSYVLKDLDHVHIVRQRGGRGPAGSRTMGVSALVASLVVMSVAWQASVLLAVAGAITLVTYALICLRLSPSAHHELVASYRDRRVVLYGTDDQREFDQICRALQRAFEFQERVR